METVVILGASNKTDRYSYRALKLLREYNHEVIPVHPVIEEIEGVEVVKAISDIDRAVDTVTVYVNPKHMLSMVDDLIALKPKRVIFNPGTEDDALIEKVEESGIKAVRGCTLVMLKTNQY